MPRRITVPDSNRVFDNSEFRYALRNLTNAGRIVTRSRSKILEGTVLKSKRRQNEDTSKVGRSQASRRREKDKRSEEVPQVEETDSHEMNVDSANSAHEVQCDLLEKYRKLEEALGAKLVNVVDRLKLDYVPHCVQDMIFCSTHHSKKCPRPEVADRYQSSKAKHLVDEDRTFHFLKFVEDMCIRTEFPGDYIITRLWNLILTVNYPENENYSSKNVVQDCVLVFENILFKFPPCWYDIRDSYSKVLTEPFNLRNVLPSTNASDQTILQFVVSMISKVMTEEDNSSNGGSQALDISDDCFLYQEWEARNTPKHNFEVLSRNDKLDRLFLILHLVTKILELDLSIWMLRYLSKPNKHIFDDKGPLISKVFKFDLYNQITDPVKEVLKVFICCVCFSYPTEQIDIISRMVSLLSVTINLCEKPTTKKIKYPNIGPITEAFSKEIFKTVDNYVGKSVSHYLAVIAHIRIPFIKYLVIDHLLYKMNPDPGQMCVKKIFENFRNKRWLQCEEQYPLEHRSTQPENSCKYPVVPKVFPKPKASDIYREQYLDILLEALEAYCDVYAIKEVALVFNPKGSQPQQEGGNSAKYTPKIPIDKKLKLNLIERDINKLTAALNVHQKCVHTEIQLPKLEGIHVDDVVMLHYRRELRYLSLFQKNISILREEFGSILDKWYNFTQNELFAVN